MQGHQVVFREQTAAQWKEMTYSIWKVLWAKCIYAVCEVFKQYNNVNEIIGYLTGKIVNILYSVRNNTKLLIYLAIVIYGIHVNNRKPSVEKGSMACGIIS